MVEGFFEQIPDSRQDWKVLHNIDEILTIVMSGISAGENTIHGIYAFSKIKEQWLREKVRLKLPHGLPSYDTIRRTLGMIDPKVFQKLFIKWIEEKLELKEGEYISIDGKTLRGSGNEEKNIFPLHLLHAYSHKNGIVIGQKECKTDKENEISCCPELLDMLKIKDALITTDAMMCQKEICKKIIDKECGYVLAVKKNHPTMFEEIKELFKGAQRNSCQVYETNDKGHGRIEKRIYYLDTDIKWFCELKEWQGLRAFGKCDSHVIKKGKETVESRYFICSVEDVMDFAQAVRNHWAVENNLHWCLDVIFREDECPILDRNTAQNIAIIRRIIYNRIKMQLKPKEQLCFGKRSCMYDDNYRLRILFSHA
jgi:transposase DDE domain